MKCTHATAAVMDWYSTTGCEQAGPRISATVPVRLVFHSEGRDVERVCDWLDCESVFKPTLKYVKVRVWSTTSCREHFKEVWVSLSDLLCFKTQQPSCPFPPTCCVHFVSHSHPKQSDGPGATAATFVLHELGRNGALPPAALILPTLPALRLPPSWDLQPNGDNQKVCLTSCQRGRGGRRKVRSTGNWPGTDPWTGRSLCI